MLTNPVGDPWAGCTEADELFEGERVFNQQREIGRAPAYGGDHSRGPGKGLFRGFSGRAVIKKFWHQAVEAITSSARIAAVSTSISKLIQQGTDRLRVSVTTLFK